MAEKPELNRKSVFYYLTLHYVPTGESFIKGEKVNTISPLEPKDWQPLGWSEEFCRESVKYILLASCRHMLEKEKKIGVMISGGIDSTIVLSVLREVDPNRDIHSFTLGFGQDDPTLSNARIVSEIYETEHHEIIRDGDLLRKLPDAMRVIGEPKRTFWPYYIFEEARRYVNLMVTGDGGDELFAGYDFRYQNILENRQRPLRAYIYTFLRDILPNQHEVYGWRFDAERRLWRDMLYAVFARYFKNRLPLLARVFLADYNVKLRYEFIPRDEKLAKHFGLKRFCPFLSSDMVNFASHIPLEHKVKDSVYKYILRSLLKHKIVKSIRLGPKQGFGPNLLKLWQDEVKGVCESKLPKASIAEDGWVSGEFIKKALRMKHTERTLAYINKLWDILTFEVWHDLFMR